jgi:cytochrome P450
MMARSLRDPLGFLTESRERYGDVFRYRIGPFLFHLVSHPDHVRHVLHDHNKNYVRSWLYKRTKEVIGDGLVSTEGDVWRRQRRMIQPVFTRHRVLDLAPAMTDIASEMMERWRGGWAARGEPFDVYAEMMRLTLQVVGRTLMGVDLSNDVDVIGRSVTEMMFFLERRISSLVSLPPWVPTPRNLRFRRALGTMNGIIYDIIARRRAEGAAGDRHDDLISMLMSARDPETGEAMTDLEVRDQVITFIGAGHETTAVALTWAWYLMSRHPEVEARVRGEVTQVLNGRVPTVKDLPRLGYLRQVLEETMRLYPPVYAVARDAVEDDEIGGYLIARKSSVVVSQYVTHRHPEFWPDPERFDPDRFAPERVAERPRFAWFPFLGGPHQCIGESFAMMEAQLVIATVMQSYRLELAPGANVSITPVMSLRPTNGLPMIARAV